MKTPHPEPRTELENVLVSTMKDDMVRFVHDHPESVKEALDLAISDRQPYAWRAAWLLTNVVEENDKRVRPYVGKIMDMLEKKDDGHMRELLKILVRMNLDEDHEGRLLGVCVKLWKTASKVPAVRYTAFRFIYKVALQYPELIHEVELLTAKEYMDSLSRGVKHSVEKMMGVLKG
ncbi:MAG: hypothetical protein H6585_14280 [Flavobacteriales bacterium]|nr:hypothetical protein [Flavobacteriales bacterium]MCB9449497.1 hypothetical protein [Flavobacteriales bacterium]